MAKITEAPRERAGESSTVASYCLGIMESSWLASAVLVPLFYNPHAIEGFQPNKVVFLRILALICIAAASIRWLLQVSQNIKGFRFRSSLPTTALDVALVLLVVAYLLATVFSINRSVSLWGVYEYMDGTFTFVCVLVLFGCIVAHLRTREQVERLVTTVLVTSFPMALYGIMQRVGWAPIKCYRWPLN